MVDCDPRVLEFAGRRLACPTATDLSQMLDSQPCDAVVIATPPVFHNDAIAQAIEAGKHILCEKPLTIELQKTRKLIQAAAEKNLVFATGLNHRFYGPVMDALKILQSGRIGQLQNMDARIGQELPADLLNGWMGRFEISGGGVVTDNGSHLIDLIRLFAGDISTFHDPIGTFSSDHPGIETHLESAFQSRSGLSGRMICSWTEQNANYLEMKLQGTLGRIELAAFPWQLKATMKNGESFTRRYIKDRILMKFMGLKAPGLEMSLIRELTSFRAALLGCHNSVDSPTIATAVDGLQIAEWVDHLRSEITNQQPGNAIISWPGQSGSSTWAKSA